MSTRSPEPRVSPEVVATPVILTRDLGKRFAGEIVVEHVSFDVPTGSIFGFIGPSGSGKTTTVRMLTGIYAPSEGQVRVLGSDPRKFGRNTRARIGYMPQHFVLYPHLTVWENLNFAASLYGMGLRRGKALKSVLDFVEMSDHVGKIANDTSGGMKRRLSLAATLVHDPELVFLDEPTAGIDPILRRKFWDHFRELKDQGRTLFITTQYVNEASYCDLVGVMDEGRLLVVDTPEGLRRRAFGGDIIQIVAKDPVNITTLQMIQELPFVRQRVIRTGPTSFRVVVDEAATAIPDLVEWMRVQNLSTESIEEFRPPFDDVFVELIKMEPSNV